MRVINLIVVHCSATKADRDFTEQDLEVCHRRRGMNGPGYHFYIRKNGDIKTTRPIEKIGAHARGHNAQSIGICYEGGNQRAGQAGGYADGVAETFVACTGQDVAGGLSRLQGLRSSGFKSGFERKWRDRA